MYTKQALRELGVMPGALNASQLAQLDEQGFTVVEGVFSPAQSAAMAEEFDRLHRAEGELGGHEVHVEPGAPRVSNIFNKSMASDACLTAAPILEAAHLLLGEIKVHGANLRDPLPGQGQQALHCDVPKRFADDWWIINAMVLIDLMTLDNGPTRIVPGSHRWAPINVPEVNAADWEPTPPTPEDLARIPADLEAPYPGEAHAQGPAGAVVLCNGHLWHGGTTNRSSARRRMLHLTYTRRDLPQQLVQRDYLTPDLFACMSPPLRWLLDIDGDDEPMVRRSAASTRVTGKWPH
jgi:ectoine hydroxylase-related dioxygenase (phytanoyl-CoA dioxygenase family)